MGRIKKNGWIPDIPDHRDVKYKAPLFARVAAPVTLPSSVDLRSVGPNWVFDQGDLGSCTANAIGAAFVFEQIKQKEKTIIPSRLFIYYNERAIEGTVNEDSGAQIRDGIKTLNKQGVCDDSLWPYNVNKFITRPPVTAYTAALKDRAVQYLRVSQNSFNTRHCLASGYPFVFGFTVYDSFETPQVAKTGIVSMPGPNEGALGGHAVLAVGYDDKRKAFLVRNSWGPNWGIGGHFWLPYDYLLNSNLADDFWTLRLVN